MPKHYCDYCDIYLTHDSPSVRRSHCAGWKHRMQVRNYYTTVALELGLISEELSQTIMNSRVPGARAQSTSVRPPPSSRAPPPPSAGLLGRPDMDFFAPNRPPPFGAGPPPPHFDFFRPPGAPNGHGHPPPPPGYHRPPPPGMYGGPPPHHSSRAPVMTGVAMSSAPVMTGTVMSSGPTPSSNPLPSSSSSAVPPPPPPSSSADSELEEVWKRRAGII